MVFGRRELSLNRVNLEISAEIGSANLEIGSLLHVGRGAIIPLSKSPDGEVDLTIENHLIARGTLDISKRYFEVRITKTSVDIHE